MVNKYELDLKDRKILKELDFNARQMNSEIAKKSGLSKKSVEYRIHQMEKNSFIQGYYPIVDFMKLGYYYCRVFFKLQHLNEVIKKAIGNYILNNKFINWAIWFYGDYDIGMAVWAKSLDDFKEQIDLFSAKFSDYIREKKTSMLIELDHYPYRFITCSKDSQEAVMKNQSGYFEIDNLDKKILMSLTKNARKNSSEIARELKSNYKTVSYRINKLAEKGILLKTRAVINHQLLGYTQYKVFFHMKKNNEKLFQEFKEYLRNYLGTIYFIEEISIADFEIEVMCLSNTEFFGFLESLQNKFSDIIVDYDYTIMTDTIKVNFLPGKMI